MISAREGILDYLRGLLDGAGGAPCERSRKAAAARAEGVVIVLAPENEEPERLGQGPAVTKRDFVIVVTVLARGDVPDQVADPVVVAAHNIITADETLGGRSASMLEQGTSWEFDEADQTAVAVEMRYRVRYHTSAASLAAP